MLNKCKSCRRVHVHTASSVIDTRTHGSHVNVKRKGPCLASTFEPNSIFTLFRLFYCLLINYNESETIFLLAPCIQRTPINMISSDHHEIESRTHFKIKMFLDPSELHAMSWYLDGGSSFFNPAQLRSHAQSTFFFLLRVTEGCN